MSRSIEYGFLRDGIDKRYRIDLNQEAVIPGSITSTEQITNGALLTFQHADVEIIELAPNLIRVSWGPAKIPYPYTLNKQNCNASHAVVERNAGGYTLRMGTGSLSISDAGEITFNDPLGNILRKDEAPLRVGDGWKLTTHLTPTEHIYGLGERAAALNLRPGTYCSWNSDPVGNYSTGKDPIYIGTPIYLSLSKEGCYLVYFENSYRSTFMIGEELNADFEGGMLRYYFITGTLESIYKQLSELIGKPLLPPRWVLGYHQCRWGYKTEADIRKVVDGFNAHDLPLSAIHLDIDYLDGYRVFTVDQQRFPDLRKLTSDLNKKGIKVVTTINPAVKCDPNYPLYLDGLKKDIYCKLPNGEVLLGVSWPGWSVFPDFSKSEAREWWQEQYQFLISQGISGVWHDMNEPASFAAWGDKSFPLATLHDLEGSGGNHREFHNLYGLLMTQAGFNAVKKYSPDKRPWIFSRAGWAGLQKYAWNWTGDTETSWQSLRQTLPTILGLGLSGHAFSGVDIGGFSGSPDSELYLRWFQMAAFFPLFRTHSAIGTNAREPWVYGEPTTSIIREFLRIRYSLLPYLYTQAWISANTGYPFIRPIMWNDLQNQNLWDIQDEFMVGDRILVAPILEQGAEKRSIILPRGTWYSFWDDRQYAGSNRYEIMADMETIPIFVSAGTIFPMETEGGLTLHVYPGLAGESYNQLYSDAGDGYESWRVDTFGGNYRQDQMEIDWEVEGEFPFPYHQVKIQLHGHNLLDARVDDTNMPIENGFITTPPFHSCSLRFDK